MIIFIKKKPIKSSTYRIYKMRNDVDKIELLTENFQRQTMKLHLTDYSAKIMI